MSHEPECSVAIHANFFPELSSCSCDKLRTAYQRGRDDAAKVIRDIHSPSKDDEPGCVGCGTDPDHWDYWRETWPCPTIRALDGDE